jgi:SulP family sulfate permease
MYLFDTPLLLAAMVAQFVYTFASKFDSAVGLQMVENVPFCLELARIVMSEQHDNASGAISTLFFLFGCSSLIVGLVFYFLGRFNLGRIVYFFPSHVLVGCIGGIGTFIIVTAIEVSTNTTFTFTAQGFNDSIVGQFNLLLPVMIFESFLRILIYATKGKYPLLSPVYYCFITPVFYFILYCFGIDIDVAEEAGYFFPPINSAGSALSWSLVDIFTEVHIWNVSWKAVLKAIPTMISLTAFSLIHVPINIPAFGISTNCEPDMNAELIAHGYSNFIAGLFGGLQNYLAYSNSVIYSKAHGKGKLSSLAIVVLTGGIFIYGPMAASYVPRCMAGTILLHVGIELFFEGVGKLVQSSL